MRVPERDVPALDAAMLPIHVHLNRQRAQLPGIPGHASNGDEPIPRRRRVSDPEANTLGTSCGAGSADDGQWPSRPARPRVNHGAVNPPGLSIHEDSVRIRYRTRRRPRGTDELLNIPIAMEVSAISHPDDGRLAPSHRLRFDRSNPLANGSLRRRRGGGYIVVCNIAPSADRDDSEPHHRNRS